MGCWLERLASGPSPKGPGHQFVLFLMGERERDFIDLIFFKLYKIARKEISFVLYFGNQNIYLFSKKKSKYTCVVAIGLQEMDAKEKGKQNIGICFMSFCSNWLKPRMNILY